MQELKKNARYLNLFLLSSVASFSYALETVADQSANVAVGELAKTALKEVIGVGFGGIQCVNAITSIYYLGKDIKSYVSPTMAEKTRLAEAQEKYDLLMARKEFRECFISNSKSPKNSSGIPNVCADVAEFFALTADQDEFNKAMKVFNRLYKD